MIVPTGIMGGIRTRTMVSVERTSYASVISRIALVDCSPLDPDERA